MPFSKHAPTPASLWVIISWKWQMDIYLSQEGLSQSKVRRSLASRSTPNPLLAGNGWLRALFHPYDGHTVGVIFHDAK
ncbi:hypothetical protein [Mesorhizobium onobrychidis]|uniref:Uncharacterized protein n=1 Tax=Mesorhizobium onobrychidis TaxID=2775404 RepID=A0ABY5R3Z7_9HYPH|nr:hypothetical protein [Mesorhizobium onobrychidis]UVC18196.1 hypothetical protein IHQ72_14570 [Mesorhizobium onobrychidis]